MNIGIIFEWDEVLFGSQEIQSQAWKTTAEDFGYLLPEQYKTRIFCRSNEEIIKNIFNWAINTEQIKKISEHKEFILGKYIQNKNTALSPEVIPVLENLYENKVKMIINSISSSKTVIEDALLKFNIKKYFFGIVTDKEFKNINPEEDLELKYYLKACEILGLFPSDCIIAENSISNIQIAKDAGFNVLAITGSNPLNLLQRTNADIVIENFSQINSGLIQAIISKNKK